MGIVTSISVEKGYARLERATDQGYLDPKLRAASVVPKLIIRTLRGKSTNVNMKQLAVALMIWLDEKDRDYLWYYKAEVTFNVPLSGTPVPVLTANSKDKNRRHSHNPFGQVIPGAQRRRPDIIIVKDKNIRWPGRAATYPTGEAYMDNLSRVVEVKFEGDELSKDQDRDYEKIAGGRERFTVLKVTSYDDTKGKGIPVEKPLPVYADKPQPKGYFFEEWIRSGGRVVDSVVVAAQEAYRNASKQITKYSREAEQYLRNHAPWIFEGGKLVRDAATNTWKWMNEQGRTIKVWTQRQLDAALEALKKATDWTIEEIKKIDWMQVIAVGTVVVLVIAIGVAVTFFTAGAGTAPYAASVQAFLTSIGLGAAAVGAAAM
jgi:hypothetical protein